MGQQSDENSRDDADAALSRASRWRMCPACASPSVSARVGGSVVWLACRDCLHQWQQEDRRHCAGTPRTAGTDRLAAGGLLWRATRDGDVAECTLRRLRHNGHWMLELRIASLEHVLEQFVDHVDGMTQGSRHLLKLLSEGWTEIE